MNPDPNWPADEQMTYRSHPIQHEHKDFLSAIALAVTVIYLL